MATLINPIALITGDTQGPAFELAKQFAHDGFDHIHIANSAHSINRLQRELNATFGIKILVISLDQTISMLIKKVKKAAHGKALLVDVLSTESDEDSIHKSPKMLHEISKSLQLSPKLNHDLSSK